MRLPFILSIPHCTDQVPAELRETMALSDHQIKDSVDLGTREIFAALPARQIIAADWSRLVVDLNRRPNQYDAKGVVATTDYLGRTIFKNGCTPGVAEIKRRVQAYYRPYHDRLAALLEANEFMGLIDCHSLNGTGPKDAPDHGQPRKDVVLSNFGDAQGRQRSAGKKLTCSTEIIQAAAAAFASQGFSVSLNEPYRGGYIVNHYGSLLQKSGRFALQIEMNQKLYADPGEKDIDPQGVRETAARVEKVLTLWARQMGT